MVRMGFASLLAVEPDMEIVAEAEDLEQGLAAFRAYRPDITLMDVRMPGGSGLEALARIRALDPSARVVILSTYDLEEPMIAAHAAGAAGYLLKSVRRPDLVAGIRRAHAGGLCFPPDLEQHLAARHEGKSLSPREIETLDLIRRGLSNKDIGRVLGISANTAKFHVKAVLAKLGVTDRAEAVAVAFQRGYLHVP